MKMLVDGETFARQVAADPDLDCEVRGTDSLAIKELLEEADQYRHPDFDSDCEKLVVRLADALLASVSRS
jgi:hypothetical protein